MGFDGLFFGRLDYADKDKRLDTKTMEMMWKGKLDRFTSYLKKLFETKKMQTFFNH
jgi:hypothetical protein